MSDPSQVAFALREGVEFDGGSVSVGDGETFDVAEALEKGEGVIVVAEGSQEHISLRGYEPLKQVAVPKKPASKSSKKPAEKSSAKKED